MGRRIYAPFILKTVNMLNDGAVFILNVGERKYPLAHTMYDICSKNGINATEIKSYLVGRGEGREKFYCLSKCDMSSKTTKNISLF